MGVAAESKFYSYLIVPSVTYFRNVKTKSKGFLTEDSFLRAASTREEALSIQNYIKTEYGVKTKLIPLLINLGAGAEFDVDTTRILNIRDNDSPNLYEALQYRGDTMTIQNKEVPVYEIAPVSILSEQIRDIEELLKPYDKIEDVNRKIDDVIAAAPKALDTLNEIAQSLADDADFAGTMTTSLSLKANDADISSVGYSGEYDDILNPPTKVSYFENDSNYLTDVSEHHVTQHQDAINTGVRITESQITNLKNYLLIGDLDPYAKTTYVNTEIADVVKEFDTSTHYLNNIKLRPAVEKLDGLISSINLNITDITKAFDANTNYLNGLELRPAIKKLDEIINPIQTTIFNSDGTTVLNYAAVNQVVSDFNDTETGFSSIQSLTDHLRTTLLDSDGNRITDLEAINSLDQRLYNNTDGSITLLQQDVTSLTTDLTRSNGSRLNVSAFDSLSSTVNDSETGLTAINQSVTNLETVLTDSDGNVMTQASALHQLITSISGDGSASAQYALELNANNHISGIYLNNDGTRSDFSVVANEFKIFNDSSNTSKPAFEVSDGEVYLKDIKVDSANIESLTVKNLEGDINVITPFSGSGSRTWGPTSAGYQELVQVDLPKNGVSGVSHIPTINMVFSGLFATDTAFIKLSMSKSSENYNTWHQIQIMRHKTAGSGSSWTVIPISGSWGVPLEEDVKFKVEVQMKNDKGTGSTNKSKTATNYWSGTVMGLVGSVSDAASTGGTSVDISQATEYEEASFAEYINNQVASSTQTVIADFDYSSIFNEYGIDFTTDDNTYIP